MFNRIGRPPGTPTVFWTKAEREAAREIMDDLAKKFPRRTLRAVVQMMLRIESGEFE